MRFDENPFMCQREKEDKNPKGFRFHTCIVLKRHHGSEGGKDVNHTFLLTVYWFSGSKSGKDCKRTNTMWLHAY